jgi:transcriptional regulator with XRE-family HTH domain
VKVSSQAIREKLGLTRAEWARALGVHERTVMRWENDHTDPGGLAGEVMRGIAGALEEGAPPDRVGRLVSLGIGSLLFYELMREVKARKRP